MSPTPTVSIIAPVLNEAALLPASLASAGALDAVQLIVVDGGSSDDSLAVARRYGAQTLVSPVRQRAAQLNLGAGTAQGEVLLFLHADTRLPANWRQVLESELQRNASCVGGAFRRRFDSPSFILRASCRLADWRGARFGWFLGDQAMFVRRDVFRLLGGFAPLPQCEDLDFSLRLQRVGRTRLLPATVISSARRFERRGALGQTLRDFVIAARVIGGRLKDGAESRS